MRISDWSSDVCSSDLSKDFDAIYMTGYGTVASYLGVPDAGVATYTDMVSRVARIAEITTTPLIADADTGYGGLLNVRETVRDYERAGCSANQIDDQEFPQKSGHKPGRHTITNVAAAFPIQVACDRPVAAAFSARVPTSSPQQRGALP